MLSGETASRSGVEADKFQQMQRLQWAIVVVGVISTILISVKAIADLGRRWSFWLGIFTMHLGAGHRQRLAQRNSCHRSAD